jgi:hypothetical protein
VTVDGTLIHKSGNMTGGRSGVEESAQRWDEKAILGAACCCRAVWRRLTAGLQR